MNLNVRFEGSRILCPVELEQSGLVVGRLEPGRRFVHLYKKIVLQLHNFIKLQGYIYYSEARYLFPKHIQIQRDQGVSLQLKKIRI